MSLRFGEPNNRKPPFKFSALTRVGFSDTDAQGIVYYGRYLPYFDLARVEYHRHLELLARDPEGLEFVMRASSVDYLAPARFDDVVEVFIRLARIGRTSELYELAAYNADDALLVGARQTLVQIDVETRRPEPIPDSYRERIRDFERADCEIAVAAG